MTDQTLTTGTPSNIILKPLVIPIYCCLENLTANDNSYLAMLAGENLNVRD